MVSLAMLPDVYKPVNVRMTTSECAYLIHLIRQEIARREMNRWDRLRFGFRCVWNAITTERCDVEYRVDGKIAR